MKQHITIEQLNELSEKGKSKLIKWMDDNRYIGARTNEKGEFVFSTPTIGQMIELLDDNGYFDKHDGVVKENYIGGDSTWGTHYNAYGDQFTSNNNKELCDALWEAVKEVLEE